MTNHHDQAQRAFVIPHSSFVIPHSSFVTHSSLPRIGFAVTMSHGRRLRSWANIGIAVVMALPRQTVVLLEMARHLYGEMPADAVLLLTETDLDWQTVLEYLAGCRLLVAAQDVLLTRKL